MKLLNQKGFSLVGAMIALSILAVGAMGTLHLMKMQTGGNKTANQNFTINGVTDEVKVIMTKMEACNKSLKNYNVTSEKPLVIYDQLERPKYKPGTNIGNSVTLEKVYIKRPEFLPNKFRGALDLVLTYRKTFGKQSSQATRKVKVIANVQGAVIRDCLSYETEAIESAVDRMCKSTGGLMSDGYCSYPGLQEGSFKDSVMASSLEQFCKYMGGNFSNNQCMLTQINNQLYKQAIKSIVCETLGGYYNGSKCAGIDIEKLK